MTAHRKSGKKKELAVTLRELRRMDYAIEVAPTLPSLDEQAVDSMQRWRSSPEIRNSRLRALLFPLVRRQPRNLIALLQHEGMHEIVEPLAWAMQMLARRTPRECTRRVMRVPVQRVLSYSWMPVRIARIFELSAVGTKPPPVSLVMVRFRKEDFYLVDDGHHRCEVARMKGEETIRARIIEFRNFVPGDWRLAPRGCLQARNGKLMETPVDVRAAARWLGVS